MWLGSLFNVIWWHFLHPFSHLICLTGSGICNSNSLAEGHIAKKHKPKLIKKHLSSPWENSPKLRDPFTVFKTHQTPWKQQVHWTLSLSKQKNNSYPLQSHKSAESSTDPQSSCLISEVNANPRVPEKNTLQRPTGGVEWARSLKFRRTTFVYPAVMYYSALRFTQEYFPPSEFMTALRWYYCSHLRLVTWSNIN